MQFYRKDIVSTKKPLIFFVSLLIAYSNLAQAVSEYHLSNGLTLLVKEDHRAPVVISEVWYKVGGSYEKQGLTGISHALEHMMFRGTKRYGPGVLERMVSTEGGHQNAFTDDDFTAYYQIFSANKLPISFKLEADRMQHLLLRSKDFEKEIQIVMEERRLRVDNNPQAMLLEQLNAAAFVESPYHHPVVGWKTDLNHMTPLDLKEWYKRWYHPNNAIITVVGDVKPQAVYQLASHYFSAIKKKPILIPKPVNEPLPLGPRRFKVYLPAQLPWMCLAYPAPSLATDPKSEDPYILDLIAMLLANSNSSWFSKLLIREKQIAADAHISYNPYSRLNGLLIIDATPMPQKSLTQLEAEILTQIKKLQNNGVSEKELNRCKTQIIANKTYEQDSLSQQAFLMGSLAAVNLPWTLESTYLQHIKKITNQQVQTVAKKYFKSEYLISAYLIPWHSAKQNQNVISQG